MGQVYDKAKHSDLLITICVMIWKLMVLESQLQLLTLKILNFESNFLNLIKFRKITVICLEITKLFKSRDMANGSNALIRRILKHEEMNNCDYSIIISHIIYLWVQDPSITFSPPNVRCEQDLRANSFESLESHLTNG